MNDEMKYILELSIVIVNWNTRQMLYDCLSSVFKNLLETRAEVIVVDNGSIDGSSAMVAENFPQVRLIQNHLNRGFAAANNQAFAIATGRFILLLNSDTLVHGNVISESTKYLDSHPHVGAMGCRVLNTDGSVQLTCSVYPSLTYQFLLASGLWKLRWPPPIGRYLMTNWLRDTEREVDVISGCYLLIRAETLYQVGWLDERFFFFGEETDWCKRARDTGWQLRFAPVGEITHHGSASVRKLDHRRDVMLTAAKVRLHRKHGGWFAAVCAWGLAAGFNVSRAAYWTLWSIIDRRPATVGRARHFRQVTAELPATWS